MQRDRITIRNGLTMASRVLAVIAVLAMPIGFSTKGSASGPVFLEDNSSQGGGVGFVLLMSLQRTG
ncbi:MAG: hypothetical protein IBJ07_15490 [Rhizobiaceae bacterium]|nr:hypothetical protein [Rhizobiaceae bacterium]